MEIWCLKGMYRLKLVSTEKKLGFKSFELSNNFVENFYVLCRVSQQSSDAMYNLTL